MCPASHSGEPGIQSEATHSALSLGLLTEPLICATLYLRLFYIDTITEKLQEQYKNFTYTIQPDFDCLYFFFLLLPTLDVCLLPPLFSTHLNL